MAEILMRYLFKNYPTKQTTLIEKHEDDHKHIKLSNHNYNSTLVVVVGNNKSIKRR